MDSTQRIGLATRLCCVLVCIVGFLFSGSVVIASNSTGTKISQKSDSDKIFVKGTVKDVDLQPIIGASIFEKGTTNGTVSDIDGHFTLEVPVGSDVQVSCIGFLSKTLKVSKDMIVILEVDTQKLEEVLVVGYSTQKKKDVTGSIAVVDADELLASTGSSAAQQLQGKAAGVYIGQSGSPGSPTMVRIRGFNTVNDNGPLFVIDGVSTRNQDLSSINPNDIESMQVLKDASSAAIYGAQAANGVILITTKKGGNTGAPVLTYNGYVGVQQTSNRYDLLNSMDRINVEWAAKKNQLAFAGSNKLPSHPQFGTGATPSIPKYLTMAGAAGRDVDVSDYSYPKNTYAEFSDTDWWNEVDRNAFIQNHQLTLAGGNDKGRYSMGLNFFDQNGTAKYTYYKRYQIRVNSQYNIRKWLRMGENLTYSWIKDNGLDAAASEGNIYSWIYRASPYVPVYDIKGHFAGSKLAGTGNFYNPVAILYRNKDNYHTHQRLFGDIWAEADILPNLKLRSQFGVDYTRSWHYSMGKKEPEFSEYSFATGTNTFSEQSAFNIRWVWSNTLNYSLEFARDHKINALIGTEAIKDGIGRWLYGMRRHYLFEDNIDAWVLSLGKKNNEMENNSTYNGEFALFGVFGRLDYSFKDRYLVSAIVRRDGVSRFSKNNRYGVFPAVSLGWRISEEDFMLNTKDWLDDLKLRVGYGENGNSEVPRKTNYAYEYVTSPSRTNYDITGCDNATEVGWRLGLFGNENTKWEATQMINIGIDASFFNNKIGLTADAYWKKTTDMLVSASYTDFAGEAGRPYINFGDVKNRGFDINIDYRDYSGDWSWDVNLNLSHYKNEVVRLAESDNASMWGWGARLKGAVARTTKGHPISEFWGYKKDGFYESVQEVQNLIPLGESKPVENPEKYVGKFKFKDVDGDGKLTSNDRTFIGSPHPDLIMGLNTNISWKNWDLSMFWYSTLGNDLYNNVKYFTDFWMFEGNRSKTIRDKSWVKGGDNSKAKLPILDYGDQYSGANSNSYYVEDASFLRLKNLIVGYTFDKSLLQKINVKNVRVYLQAENLLTFTKYSGLDPELTNSNVGGGSGADLVKGVDMGGWPTTRRFIVGVNFTF